MAGKLPLITALVAIVAFLWDRRLLLTLMYTNAPVRIDHLDTFQSFEIKFKELRSCEDVLMLPERGLAILACDPGRERYNTVMGVYRPGPVSNAQIYLYDYKDSKLPEKEALKTVTLTDFPSPNDFHTLGIHYDEKTSRLFAVSHAQAGSRIELFDLNLQTAEAKYLRTIQHPLLNAPNAIAVINDHEIYVTNDHYFPSRVSIILSRLETYLGFPLGSVVHVDFASEQDVVARRVARVPFANGIAELNATTLAVASSNSGALLLYDQLENRDLKYLDKVHVPFFPDNLSMSSGKLLIAGHPHLPTLTKFSATRHICNDPAELAAATPEMRAYCETAVCPSALSEWTQEGGVRPLYVGTSFPSSTTGVRDGKRNVGIMTGLYANGIMVWKE